jgi:hypothetical protein
MMNFNRLLATQNRNVVSIAFRNFGPKAKAGGGAPAAAPYVEPSRMKTNYEIMVKKNGIDKFMFGPSAVAPLAPTPAEMKFTPASMFKTG